MRTSSTTTQQEIVDAAGLNPRKPYFKTTYRDDILRFSTPVVGNSNSNTNIGYSYQPFNSNTVLVAGYDSANVLKVGSVSFPTGSSSSVPTVSSKTSILPSGYEASIKGSWLNLNYYYIRFLFSGTTATAQAYYSNSNGSTQTFLSSTGLPSIYKAPDTETQIYGNTRRPSAFIVMESGDKVVVYTSYKYMNDIGKFLCTMNFYYAGNGDSSYSKLRTTIQYEIPIKDLTRNYSKIVTLDPSSGQVFGQSSSSGNFFIVANDGTKAVRFTYKNGVEGMLEPIIPIDLDANRLEITDSTGQKSYGKYHQFMPTGLIKINNKYYLNGKMTRTYSNGDSQVMEVYLLSADGINWSVGDVSFFIDSVYRKKDAAVRNWNYSFVYPANGTIYALGNECFSYSSARQIDTNAEEIDFSDIVIEGEVNSNSNSADSAVMTVMKGFDTIDPSVLGGKTITVNLGYYNASGITESVKMGEYFIDSELHVLSNIGKGPNKITAYDSAAWKLTRWTAITDIDRWSSTFIHDDLKAFSNLIVKGISSDYAAVDNATGSGLYLSNLNDPFIGYTSTRDDRDGMFTVCARFTDTNSKTKLSSIGILIGAEDYTDIYTKGDADKKGFNVLLFPAESDWTGHVHDNPRMRKSNLKKRIDNPSTPENESDNDVAFQWIRRYTNLWARDVYIEDPTVSDSIYNRITVDAATGSENILLNGTFSAEHGIDYEFVVRRHSGRIEAYARKKGMTVSTIADAGYTEYSLVYKYQFGESDLINWGPRPFWGLVANTDVFASLDGWNSSEYGDIETTITEAHEAANSFDKFPDSKLVSYGEEEWVGIATAWTHTTTTTYETVTPDVWYFPNETVEVPTTTTNWTNTTINPGQLTLLEKCRVGSVPLVVNEIVRCFIFADTGNAVSLESNCSQNIIRSGTNINVSGRCEFLGIISAIEPVSGHSGWKKIYFSRTWGVINQPTNGEQRKYAIYRPGEQDYHAVATSGSISANMVSSLGDNATAVIPIDIKTGAVKQSLVTAGRGAFVNRQNDAISIRFMESDGNSHYLHSGSWNQTKLGFDYPTNPVSRTATEGAAVTEVNNVGIETTRDWRLLLNQGRLFSKSATGFGLPDGKDIYSYMIKGDEIVRYEDTTFYKLGRDTLKTWCIIPAYYTPIFPSQKNSTTIQQWSKNVSGSWIEPGDRFTTIKNLYGMRLFISGKNGYSSVGGDKKYYATYGSENNDAAIASILAFSPALDSGVESMSVTEERAKAEDKQLKEIAIISGRGQLNTDQGFQTYTDPLCFYPVTGKKTSVSGQSGTDPKSPDSFIKVNYWTMNAGLYNSAKDNLEYACNLAGITDVKFMDLSGSIGYASVLTADAEISNEDVSNFVLEINFNANNSSRIKITSRNAYILYVDVDGPNITLSLNTAPGFDPARNIQGNSAGAEKIIAKVSVPISDINITGNHDLKVIAKKERIIVEMDRIPVWTFDLKTYKFGGTKNDLYTLYTDQAGPVKIAILATNITWALVELNDEVENQVIDMSQTGGEAVQFVTKERHIYARSTQNGGIQFGRFLDGYRNIIDLQKTDNLYLTSDFIKDQLEYNPFQVPGHVLVTGAEYGEYIDSDWIRQNGYLFTTNQNRLLDTVEDSVKEAKLLIRMSKEESDNSEIEIVGLPHIQPEDEMIKKYEFPESVSGETSVVSGHVIKFDPTTLSSLLKIRKKYSTD